MFFERKRYQKLIGIATILIVFTSNAQAELSDECKKHIVSFIQIESLKDNALTVEASKETVGICVYHLKDATDRDAEIIGQIMQIGKEAEKELLQK